jgi:hypothetical protein
MIMKTTVAIAALLFLAAADARQPLLGHWTGSSKCTAVRPACHDEIASYYIKPGPSEDVVTIEAGKIVDGKDVWMGTTDFHVDFAAHVLSGFVEMNNQRWPLTFTWSGDTITGTYEQPDGQVIRNVRITKQPK